MSPLSLRRYRAERMLREEFDALRRQVLSGVEGRLRAAGTSVERADLEACYAVAWHGLYAAVLDGQDIVNPTGWLVLVTFRRAVDEHRARVRAGHGGEHRHVASPAPRGRTVAEVDVGVEADIAGELDDRARLRQLFEGIRRLGAREREAATLCYLHGFSRAEAAARMGVSEARMRKLMEGHGARRPGVAGKVGALVETIREGGWCEQQGSLMRALAFGILDPEGERYQLALAHRDHCPACRADVASLRGLAAALPPVLLPWGVGAETLARVLQGGHAGGVAASAGGAGGAGVGAGSGGGIAAPLSASGAAGGASGGGWLLTGGGLTAKLAVGCLLAAGVGAGCVALEGSQPDRRAPRRHVRVHAVDARVLSAGADAPAVSGGAVATVAPVRTAATNAKSVTSLTPATRASREFGPEQDATTAAASAADAAAADAHAASAGGTDVASSSSGGIEDTQAGSTSGASGGSSDAQGAGGASAAEREFSPG